MSAVIHRPGEGERHAAGASDFLIKATSEDTGGTFFLSEAVIAPASPGPPPHWHEHLHDMFYVLEGTLTMQLGEETHEAGPGTFVCVPPGVVHAFRNASDEPVRFLNFNTPGGFEHYMRDLAEAARSGAPLQEAVGRVASRYDIRLVT